MRDAPLVFGFSGPSGSGKTTLLEALVAELVARGREVGAVKHASHAIDGDRPGKDSFRLYASGARAVALAGPDQVVTFARTASGAPPALRDALAALPAGLEVVLVEGYLREPVPRYLVLPRGATDDRGYGRSGPVLRVIETAALEGGRPRFDPALVKDLADDIERALAQSG